MKSKSIALLAALLLTGCFWGDYGPNRSELETAKDQASDDLHCEDVNATVFEPGYVSVYGCSTRATYECSHSKHGGWSCRRMY